MENFDLDQFFPHLSNIDQEENKSPVEEEKPVNKEDIETTNSEEEIVTNKEDNQSENTSEKPAENNNQLKNYFEFLKESGLIIVPDDYDTSDIKEESLLELKTKTLEEYKKSIIEDLTQKLPDDFKKVLQYGLSGGQNPFELFNQNLRELDIDIENENSQKEIIKLHLRETTSLSDDRISKIVDRLQQSGELQEEAFDALEELKQIEDRKAKELIKEKKKLEAEKIENDRKVRNDISKIISDSSEIPSERKSKIQAFMFNPINKDNVVLTDFQRVLSTLENNKSHLVQLADILFDYDPKSGFNFDRFKKLGETKVTKSLKEKLENKFSSSKSTSIEKSPVSKTLSVNWEDFL